MRRRVDRLGIPPELTERLEAAGISTAAQLFEASRLQLMHVCDLTPTGELLLCFSPKLTHEGVKELLRLAAGRINISSKSAASLLETVSFLPSGIQELDSVLGGGIQIGTLTEVVGPPGTGKTQFCIGCSVFTLGNV